MLKSAPTLRELQKSFRAAITASDARLLTSVEPLPPLSRAARVEIYAQAWFLRLEESLLDDFPLVAEKLGAKKFSSLLKPYLRKHPSRTYTLALVGEKFPEFLRARGQPRWIVDLARLERAQYRVFSAVNALPWDASTLSRIPPVRLRMELQPSVELLEVRSKEGALAHYVVYRDGWSLKTEKLSSAQYRVLLGAQKRATLSALLKRSGDNPAFGRWIAQWCSTSVLRPLGKTS
ncbi:MAG: HvfC/BufC family peptide modification chaperone [Bdellovibrionota bacterium]